MDRRRLKSKVRKGLDLEVRRRYGDTGGVDTLGLIGSAKWTKWVRCEAKKAMEYGGTLGKTNAELVAMANAQPASTWRQNPVAERYRRFAQGMQADAMVA